MSITIKYDRPVDNQLSVGSSLPIDTRNLTFLNHNFATVSGQITFDNSYPTGGYAAPNAKFGLSTVNGVLFEEPNGYSVKYNRSTDKIQLYSTGNTEVANATDLSALPACYFEAKGLV